MPNLHLPTHPLGLDAVPDVVDRHAWEKARDELLAREKAHTREGDAIAAARRRLPMTQVPDDATVWCSRRLDGSAFPSLPAP